MNLAGKKEPELKQIVLDILTPSFHIFPGDDEGGRQCVHFFTGKRLRPDFICYPRKELYEYGWPKHWMFYIEVKDIVAGNGASRLHEVAWQAKQYQDCICEFKQPAFTLVFPDFNTILNASPTCANRQTDYADWFAGYMQREKVGELFIYGQDKWKIKFASSVLYDHGDKRQNFGILDKQHRGLCQ
jgi:hypothetical protein